MKSALNKCYRVTLTYKHISHLKVQALSGVLEREKERERERERERV